MAKLVPTNTWLAMVREVRLGEHRWMLPDSIQSSSSQLASEKGTLEAERDEDGWCKQCIDTLYKVLI